MPQELKDLDLTKALRILMKGDPGSRKSSAAGSFPEPYFLDMDRKIGSIQRWFPNKKILFDQPKDLDAMIDILEVLARRCSYGTVIVDSVTAVANAVFKLACTFRSSDSAKLLVGANVELLQIQDYQMEVRAFDMITDLLGAINKQGVNVIMTAHVIATQQTDLKTKIVTTKQSILTAGQKAAVLLPGSFSEVYHFYHSQGYAGKKNYLCATENIENNYAMTALNVPGSIDWTDKNFYETLMGSIKNDTTTRI